MPPPHTHTPGDTPLSFEPPSIHIHYFIYLSFPLPPPLHVILCHSPCAKLHWSELPQYWGIVSYTGNFLPRCQAYFTLICLQRLLIKQSCLYTYLYRSRACATLHTALNSMLLNIYLCWMSVEAEWVERVGDGGGKMEKCVPGWCFSCLDLLHWEIPYQPAECFRILWRHISVVCLLKWGAKKAGTGNWKKK